jgi:hypothetical protein
MSSKPRIPRLAAAGLFAFALSLTSANTLSGEWFDLNDRALAKLDFQGMALPASPSELLKRFPDAKRDRQRVDEQIGLECYELGGLENADVARFYFCDDSLYQVEIGYNLARVRKLGGMRLLVQKFVDMWGPADHAGESRWTWQRPMFQRRADFYAWPELSLLTITDLSLMPVVAQRLKRQDQKDRSKLEF